MRDEVHTSLGGECNTLECPVLRAGGVADHVHILCRLGRIIAISDLIKEVKRASTLWVEEKLPTMSEFHWQNGYGAFSISPAQVNAVREYIANQEEHHRTVTFQDEFRRLLTKYGLNGMNASSGIEIDATPSE